MEREHRDIGACALNFNRSDIQSVLAQGIVRSSFDHEGRPLPVTDVPGLFCNQCARSGPEISLDGFRRGLSSASVLPRVASPIALTMPV